MLRHPHFSLDYVLDSLAHQLAGKDGQTGYPLTKGLCLDYPGEGVNRLRLLSLNVSGIVSSAVDDVDERDEGKPLAASFARPGCATKEG
jgi:hypothetical protein